MRCKNCSALLTGQYCSQCGHRARSRLISLRLLFAELLGELLEFDSRLWITLRYLLFKPGRLTAEYLIGRQASYLPPFRLYLVLSVVFFLVAGGEISVDDSAPLGEGQLQGESSEAGGESGFCDLGFGDDDPDLEELQAFLGDTCERIEANPSGFASAIADNLPLALFVSLPLLALFAKLLYLRSGRYLVEHLLFFVHFHSFCFLLGVVVTPLEELFRFLGMSGVATFLSAAAAIYVPCYLFLSMRTVYIQTRTQTALRFIALAFFYAACFTVGMAGTLLITFLLF